MYFLISLWMGNVEVFLWDPVSLWNFLLVRTRFLVLGLVVWSQGTGKTGLMFQIDRGLIKSIFFSLKKMMQIHLLLNASPICCSISSHQRCSIKKQFSKISQNSQEAPASESLFKWSCRSQTCNFIKKRLWHLLLLLRLSLAIPESVDPPEFILRHSWKYWTSFLNFLFKKLSFRHCTVPNIFHAFHV